MVGWHSPKEYQQGIDRIQEELEEVSVCATELRTQIIRKKPPKSKFCRKLKGKHEFGEWKPYFFGWEKDKSTPKGWFVRFCIGCNRKDTWIAPTLPGPYWKLDLNARPPGYNYDNDSRRT